MVRARRILILTILSIATLPMVAFGEGSEGKGDEPIKGVNLPAAYKTVADLKSRVYWREVNGDFYSVHRGNADAVNEAIGLFQKAGGRDVVLWPASGKEQTFAGEAVPCDFTLHVPGGIAMVMLGAAKTADGTPVFEVQPTMTIYLGDALAPSALKLPKELNVLEPSDLGARYREGLRADAGEGPIAAGKDAAEKSRRTKSATVRAQSAYHLGLLSPIPDEVVPSLRATLGDPESYVRICAISALGQLGAGATSAVPDLEKAMAAAADDREKAAADTAIKAISKAEITSFDRIKARIAEIRRLKASRS